MIRSIIFDFDGTLFDSMSIWETACADYLATLSLTAESDLSEKIKTMSLLQAAEYLKAAYALPMTVEGIMNGINKTVEDFYFYHAVPKESVMEFVCALNARGIKMCIATATDRYQVEAALKRCGMLENFEAIYTCTEVGHGKDEPYIFERACEYLGTPKSETAVFEDAYHAAQTAKNAGFYVIGVYDRFENRAEELKILADMYVNNIKESGKLFNI